MGVTVSSGRAGLTQAEGNTPVDAAATLVDGKARPLDRSPVLEMRDIRKTFAHIVALAQVSLTAFSGEVHALMG